MYLGGIEKIGMKYCYWKNTSDITETYTIKLKACRICAVCCKISKKLIASLYEVITNAAKILLQCMSFIAKLSHTVHVLYMYTRCCCTQI